LRLSCVDVQSRVIMFQFEVGLCSEHGR
jgi:hypothetical protein